ncbi:MAG: BamA/TamA family outer membrane protein [Prevotella sp.]|nr:BamA/TamA family outer membrane protein [Prevotella sp.]
MAVVLAAIVTSCDGTKFVAENDLLLSHNYVVSTDKSVDVSNLSPYLSQKTNTRWFSTLKVPLSIYSLAGRDTTKAINRRLKKWGEAPVVLDTAQMNVSCVNLKTVMHNRGYLDAEVKPYIVAKKRRASVIYEITPKEQYTLKSFKSRIADRRIDSLLNAQGVIERAFEAGEPFSVNKLYAVRNDITTLLNNNGYYYFNKENITFVADSSYSDKTVDVTMLLGLYRRSSRDSLTQHPYYYIRNISYSGIPGQELNIRHSTLDNNNLIEEGDYYSSKVVQQTYNKFARLKAIRSTNIHFNEVADTNALDVNIQIARKKTHSIQIQPEGTNTAGDFGAALSVIYENRNIFHGSEQLSIQARGAFEAIRGLEGYDNSNYEELELETKLTFPKLIMPGISKEFQKRHDVITELPISYNIQSRPEFRRKVLTATCRYKWSSSKGRVGYTFDIIDLNFISMPWISETFKREYLDNESNRNAILRYNYEDLFIMKIGFGLTYSDTHNTLRTNIETSGNLLYALANTFNFAQNSLGQYKVANVAFAQYVKFDADYTHLYNLDSRNTLALHARIGVGVPYCNSSMLPFEKRYFAGGANSVRGWNVRTLGPGRYIGTDGRIDFINQTGDIKIDLNAELRTNLFWKFQGALFVDAGNVWTIRAYEDQPDGYFKLKSIYDEMAVSYGVGLRLNFDYFILRLDMGMKAVNPAYTTTKEHFPIFHPVFSRDYALHFAVGLPF